MLCKFRYMVSILQLYQQCLTPYFKKISKAYSHWTVSSSDGSGSKIFDPGKVGSIFFVAQVRSGWLSHIWFESGFGKFTLKIPSFSIFFLRVQKNTRVKEGWPLIYCGSKVSLGQSGVGPSLVSSNVSVIYCSHISGLSSRLCSGFPSRQPMFDSCLG